MRNKDYLTGILCALFTVMVWGSTFVASKVLLEFYTPSQIMLVRFLLAYGALWLLRPRKLHLPLRQEAWFVLLGLAGCSAYFYTENSALTYTLASNVSIIVAASPMFTAILAHFAGEERIRRKTIFGFLIASTGVILVVLNGTFVLKLNPRGDLFALSAAACWAVYSVSQRKLAVRPDPILMTRRTLFWGIVTSVPIVLLENAPFSVTALTSPVVLGNYLFLGLFGSGLCYVLWNKAFRLLGVVTTNSFIYLQPFWTILVAWLLLGEPISPLAILGAALITIGVIAAQRKPSAKHSQ